MTAQEGIVSLSRFDRFIESRRAEATRRTYQQGIKALVGDADSFIALAEADKRRAEDLVINAVIARRGHVKGASIVSCIARVKSMMDFYELPLNWKKIKQVAPKSSFVGLDRAPVKEEIRLLLDKAPLREKVAVLCMASGGLRVGAFEFLDVGHLKVLESGVGLIRVYAGEPEEYFTLISPEAVRVTRSYFAERERFGNEQLTSSSPFLRNLWDFQSANGVKRERTAPARYATTSLQREVRRIWIRSGVRTNDHEPGKRKEFKSCHGFRKFAKTQLSRAGVSWEDQEVLLGHLLNYYKPTLEHLEEVYLKAVPFLTVSETEELKVEIAVTKKEDEDYHLKLEHSNLMLEKRLRDQEERMAAMERWFELERRRKELS